MATQQLAFERGGEKRVELSWDFNWRNFTIKLDNQLIGTIEGGMKAIKEGRDFTLPDGSTLHVGLKPLSSGVSALAVMHNGKVLPGSAADPVRRLRNAYWIIYILAATILIVGLGSLFSGTPDTTSWIIFGAGLVLLALGYFTAQRSTVALLAAILLLLAGAIYGFYDAVAMASQVQIPAIIRVLGALSTLYFLWLGLGAIKELKQEETGA
ncbi:MAG: hypothetical protein KF726_08295 [Anaerolineae bacterium]|nr:hypothetical protein [Anaerolineae bacterium]